MVGVGVGVLVEVRVGVLVGVDVGRLSDLQSISSRVITQGSFSNAEAFRLFIRAQVLPQDCQNTVVGYLFRIEFIMFRLFHDPSCVAGPAPPKAKGFPRFRNRSYPLPYIV